VAGRQFGVARALGAGFTAVTPNPRSVAGKSFLVVYEYGMGGLWAIMHADSAEAIADRYPELTIVKSRPAWMTDERFANLGHYELDSEPADLIRAIVADRDR
jgi:hypothetical protein